MDLNKYMKQQIKTYESLMKLIEEPEGKSNKVKNVNKNQQVNSYLMNKINDDIKNRKLFANHHKAVSTGMPVVQEDDNIRLINSNISLDANLEIQFNSLMSKYIKDPRTLTNLTNSITPNMIAEFVHNFGYYESEIRKFRGQYIDDKVFIDKLKNMLLKNVNVKYPATIPLNNALDTASNTASNSNKDSNTNSQMETMQKYLEEKNRSANETISENEKIETDNIQKNEFMINNIIGWIGTHQTECSKKFELASSVKDIISKKLKCENFGALKNMLINLSKANQKSFEELYEELHSIYTGEKYRESVKNNITLINFINNIKEQSESFRTFLINTAITDYDKQIESKNADNFGELFRKYFLEQLGLPIDARTNELKQNKLYELNNLQILKIITDIIPATIVDYHMEEHKDNNEDNNEDKKVDERIEDIVKLVGTSQKSCDENFELHSVVKDLFKNYFEKFNINLTTFSQLKKKLSDFLKASQEDFNKLNIEIENIYRGNNIPSEEIKDAEIKKFKSLINLESFRTFLIRRANKDFDTMTKNIPKEDISNFNNWFFKPNMQDKVGKDLKFDSNNIIHKLTNKEIIKVIDVVIPQTKKHYGHYLEEIEIKSKKLKQTNKKEETKIPEDTAEGKTSSGLKSTEKAIHKKYFIDTHKLHNNVLEIRYNKNRHLTNVKTQVVGDGVKKILNDVIHTNTLNEKEYHVLTDHEKHLIRTILNMLEKAHLLSSGDQQFNNKFQILLGEWNSGNNSEIIRSQLKQYISHAMKLNLISRHVGQQMLLELCF